MMIITVELFISYLLVIISAETPCKYLIKIYISVNIN